MTGTLAVPASGPFAVENLAGRMTVVPGDGDQVVATATVHAESESLASAMRFEQARDKDGAPVLRLIYPVAGERRIRYPEAGEDGGNRERHGRQWHWFFDFLSSNSSLEYDRHRVHVSSSSGTLLYADVEVRVPKRALQATFRNFVGALKAEGIEGRIVLDTTRGAITARRLKGEITADTGSSDVVAEVISGSLTCDTGSGACIVNGFEGNELYCDTGSGDVRVSDVKAERLRGDTGSGRIRAERADVEEFSGDTGSGGIDAELTGARLRRVKADTGSGDVTLRLPADASFDASADQGSGELSCAFADATAVTSDHKVVGYRRGNERARITIDTGSGDARIERLK
ncbi:MAG TPA: DUF4097 family beta strand repeat-containing protein [Thermoanaerobaculaceae bacterium]|nr:DUF4097 family beta strand repeat-containing protein [Thermoanaerobaculaceae bacterium]